MVERKGDTNLGDDRGTKAEHGIGREETEGQDRGTKAEHGIGRDETPIDGKEAKGNLVSDSNLTELKDPKVGVSSYDSVGHPFDTSMTYDEALAATMDPSSALYEKDIPADLVFAEENDEDTDWDDNPEIEVDVDVDVEVEVDMDTDVNSETDDDNDSESVIWPEF